MIERTFIEEAMKKINLETYLKKELGRAGFTGMTISKTPLVTRIVLNVARPGLAIGKGGKTIRNITEEMEKTYKISNPQIEINEIQNPLLDSKAMVDRIIGLLERGYSWRSVTYKTVDDIINAGAQGVELMIKGKLSGKGGRKMKQRIAKGYMKKAGGLTSLVDYAKGDAYPKAGAIGVKLRIIRPGITFPDKLDVRALLEQRLRVPIEETKEVAEKDVQSEASVEDSEATPELPAEKVEDAAASKEGIVEGKEVEESK